VELEFNFNFIIKVLNLSMFAMPIITATMVVVIGLKAEHVELLIVIAITVITIRGYNSIEHGSKVALRECIIVMENINLNSEVISQCTTTEEASS